ncbi:hypothetical protein [Streptomyces mirabilis]|uniref:hypothetical protein n=1 Tax=Streptomyces mirabilis TaxID=68239 RepID=UPI0036B2D923
MYIRAHNSSSISHGLAGAALGGSPLSGGYAGAKATIKFICAYAAAESERDALGVKFVSVLPKLSPATDLGANGVAAYAARQGAEHPRQSFTRSPMTRLHVRWTTAGAR